MQDVRYEAWVAWVRSRYKVRILLRSVCEKGSLKVSIIKYDGKNRRAFVTWNIFLYGIKNKVEGELPTIPL